MDEVQLLPDIFKILRVLADRPESQAQFMILGSASPDLNLDSLIVVHAGEDSFPLSDIVYALSLPDIINLNALGIIPRYS